MTEWSHLLRYRRRIAAGVVCLAGTAAAAAAIPWLLEQAIEALDAAHGGAARAARFAALMAVCAVVQCLIRIASRLFLFDAARSAEYDLRHDVFEHLLRLSPSFFRGMPTGEVVARFGSDAPALRAMWGPGVLNLANTVLVVIVTLGLLLRIDPVLTAWALLPYPLIALYARRFGRSLLGMTREVQDQMGELSASLQEDLAGIHVVKSYTLEAERARRFETLAGRYLDKSMALVTARGRMFPIFGALTSLGIVISLFVGGRKVAAGTMTLGELVAFQAYLGLLAWPTMSIGWILLLFQRGTAAWQRLRMILGAEPSIADGDGPPLDAATVRGAIDVKGLTIGFGDRKVLDDLTLSIPAGAMVAIVGPIGSGKSILVDAIPRLIEVPAGTVFLDGRDVTTLPLGSLRSLVGYAPQDAVLFSATIAENIAFARRGEAPPDIARAAKAAGLERDLASFPHGIDTVVGERGITLSGGQRQRVALARALAADPRILILDDSLSSVDAQTEREILSFLKNEARGRTTLLISHRVAAVSGADRIVVLDGGRVVESGTHDELVAHHGVYAELYREQLTDGALVEVA